MTYRHSSPSTAPVPSRTFQDGPYVLPEDLARSRDRIHLALTLAAAGTVAALGGVALQAAGLAL